MVKIAITGNIAAGKSEVEKIIATKGYVVYDTDKFTHQILASSQEIKYTFKDYDVFENGKISRKKLGALVFANKKLKEKLENIIHPVIKEMIINISSEKLVFVSVPLLYEANMADLFDYVIFVSANENIRLKRLMGRNSLTKEEAMLRINAQAAEASKIKKSDFIIQNNGNFEELENNINHVLTRIEQV